MAGLTGPVATSSGTLHESGNTFGTANLYNGIYRPKIHTQIQTAGANHGFQQPTVQTLFNPITNLSGQTSVVYGHSAGQLRPGFQKPLIPDFTLAAGVRKNQASV
jgi:hypothetical protein